MYFKVSLMNNISKGVWSRRPAMHQEPKVQCTSALLLWLWSSFQQRTCMTCPEINVHNTVPFFFFLYIFFRNTLNWSVWVYSLKFELCLLDPYTALLSCTRNITVVLQEFCQPGGYYSDLVPAGTRSLRPLKLSTVPRLQLWVWAPDGWKQHPLGVICTLNTLELVTSVTWLMLLLINSSHSSSVTKSFSSWSSRTLWRSKQAMAWKRKGREEHETLQGRC